MKLNPLSSTAAIALTAAAAFLWGSTTSASASPLTASNTATCPCGTFDLTGDTLLATITQTVTSPVNPTTNFVATYTEQVIRTTAGTLDFIIQVKNDGPPPTFATDDIDRVTLSSFDGFTTDVDTATNDPGGLTGGSTGPSSIDRDIAGNVVGFNLGAGLIPGATSLVLTVATDATTYTIGGVSIINSTSANGPGFEPASAPAPLIGHGLLVLLAVGGVLSGGKLLENLKKRHLHAA